MLRKILGKKSKDDTQKEIVNPEIAEKVAKMNLSDMRLYVNNKIAGFGVNADGINEILKRLTTHVNDKGEYYLKIDDMDVKKKKTFDLIILIAGSKYINFETIELMQKFMEVYQPVIDHCDNENKQINARRIKKAIETAIANIQTLSAVHNKLDVLKQH